MTFHYSYNKYNEVKMQGALRAFDGETEGSHVSQRRLPQEVTQGDLRVDRN